MAETGPQVSVIIPVRDRRAALRRALDAQTRRDFEVVVDDASTDGSGEEAQRRPVVVAPSRCWQARQGAVPARRRGVEARGGRDRVPAVSGIDGFRITPLGRIPDTRR